MSVFAPLDRGLRQTGLNSTNRFIRGVFRHHGPQGGTLGHTWPTGSTVHWVAVLLAATLIIYFI